ncbi:MAG TPA: class I SAM-dependent methyltransferase [Candidatus Acidoferrum sp.]|nr:class I SAM-dependent methyltransferase [Candidatus Acidoferrum sp.]
MTKLVESMREEWNKRAKQNAFFYIASWRKDWDEKSFFGSGEEDYQRLVAPILLQLSLSTERSSMAELGCGAGRMTRAFAPRFLSVTAIDISEVMQSRAKELLSDYPNVSWVLTEGTSLAAIGSDSLDFVFSYLVLQHYPTVELITASIREMLRILRPGGVFLFQFNGSNKPTMNWKGRTISTVLDGLVSIGLNRLAKGCAELARIDPEMLGKTWRGAALSSSQVEEIVRAAGGVPSGFTGADTPLAWCFGRKTAQAGS